MAEQPTEEQDETTGGRTSYLIDGRRVKVADLVAAGLIAPGAELRFDRRRIGASYHATVTDTGRIRLGEEGGEEFRSPSRAAMVAAGMRAVDGWRAWRVVGQRRMLDAVRQEFLDRTITVAASAPDRPAEGEARQRIHERLRQARNQADKNVPERIPVRDLLALWGATDRGDQVSQMEADLANHGLVTSPNFRAVTLDAVVLLTTPPDETTETEHSSVAAPGELPATEDDEGDSDLNVRLTVGNLSPFRDVTSVSPDSTFAEAITLMALNDFSQLAVLSGSRNLRGAVTWRSITQAMHQKTQPVFADAINARVEVVEYDRDLFDVLPILQQHEFVFVRDETRVIKGIVTTADVAHRYGAMATPFFQVGELDQTLRWILGRTFDLPSIKQLCDRKITSFDELSMGDYENILAKKEAWEKLGWPLHRRTFIARLDEIRRIRNKVMHFHPDPLPDDAVDKLQRFNKLLHHYRTPT